MTQYPQELNLDHICRRVQRNGKYVDVCFSDQTEEEQKAFLDTMNGDGIKRMCMEMAQTVRAMGIALKGVEAILNNQLLRDSLLMPDNTSNQRIPKTATPPVETDSAYMMPFGYNADGTVNEREKEVVRFVFFEHQEYFFHPPQELIDEAHAWAASEGMTLNDEEAEDMARLRLSAYIAAKVQKQFPDVRFRKAMPPKGEYPTGLKYPSRPFCSEEIIDRDLYAQVKDIMSRC